jgi:alkylation response protein AidB-like acyl-CoA dehydrogenase
VEFGDNAEEADFRTSARTWLELAAPSRGGPGDFSEGSAGGTTGRQFVTASREWQRKLHQAGWAGIAWPRQYGGQGRTLALDLVFQEEQSRFGVSTALFNVAIGMAGPTIMEHGTDRQRAEYLPPMLQGDHVWCQLFSEPGAGSDLAGISTRAQRSGGGWRVTGHKLWTSHANHADFGILLARTDTSQPRHRGITYFLLDMRSPGIDVRPIRQMNGAADFSEVFLTNVPISDKDVVGEVNRGWAVAMTTLSNERNLIGGEWPGCHELVETARARGRLNDPVVRQRLAHAWTGAHLLRLLGFRVRTALAKGEPLGPLPSLVNLLFAAHLRSTGDFALSLLGPTGLLADGDAGGPGSWQHHVLTAPCVRIASGTDEIQRNIVGERALGLPREPRANV